jgi:hypothetical protein
MNAFYMHQHDCDKYHKSPQNSAIDTNCDMAG